MAKKVLLALVVVLGALAVVVATRPESYHVERSTRIDAPPQLVFAVVNDFRTFPEWSPWAKRDPGMRTTISDPSSGVGASYAWEGKDVGKGRMTVTESQAPARVRERLEFIEPFASVAETAFDIKPAGDSGALITWAMDGRNNFVGKAFALAMGDMDKMVGKDFDEGLSNLKRVVEAKVAAATPPAAGGQGAAPGAVPPAAAPAGPAGKTH
jgi:hypothetical protein